jgi:hypothetical protein
VQTAWADRDACNVGQARVFHPPEAVIARSKTTHSLLRGQETDAHKPVERASDPIHRVADRSSRPTPPGRLSAPSDLPFDGYARGSEVIGGTCGGREVAVGDEVLYAMRRRAEHPGRVGDADPLISRDRPNATAVRPSPGPRPSPSGRPRHLGTSHRSAAPAPRVPDGRRVIVWDLDRRTTPGVTTRPARSRSDLLVGTTLAKTWQSQPAPESCSPVSRRLHGTP